MSQSHLDIALKIGEQARLGCGRQAVKVVDHAARYEAGHLATSAAGCLHSTGITEMKGLSDYAARARKALRLLAGYPGVRKYCAMRPPRACSTTREE